MWLEYEITLLEVFCVRKNFLMILFVAFNLVYRISLFLGPYHFQQSF